MKYRFLPLWLLIFISSLTAQEKIYVNLNDRSDDSFKVTVYPDDLSDKNNVYHFAATAPGMYQIIDAGRFVRSFKAFDKGGNEINTQHTSVNDWNLSDPAKISKIEYSIAETWHTPVDRDPIYRMGGTTIEDDNVVINGPDVFGFFEGRQSEPIYLKLEYPADWEVGTALKKYDDGFYHADNYDYIVDSPILLGRLSVATFNLDNTEIDIYTYSKNNIVKSDEIVEPAEKIFDALDKFVEGMPIHRYVLLFHFEDETAGAWEHSYSSFYVYQETPFTGKLEESLSEVIAHETFHMITPLNIHSQLIEHFNFVHPVLSEHLWLYEGVTEWAANIMQLRDSLINLDQHLAVIKQKLTYNDYFDPSISLKQLALNSFTLQPQFQIIYQRGALVAELMDITLLDLSGGKRGLREVIIELSKEYGPNRSFDENNFFNEFTKMTYPEIGQFINDYIVNTKPLPVKECFEKLGINYVDSLGYDSSKISVDIGLGVEGENIVVTKAPAGTEAKLGDIIEIVNGDSISLANARQIIPKIQQLKIGDKLNLVVKRNGEEKQYSLEVKPKPIRHVFSVIENPTPRQLALRQAWMRNLN